MGLFYNIKNKIYATYMKCRFPNWEDNEYNCGNLKFVWGIKSYYDLSPTPCNFYTMNDIEITYSRKSKLYSLGIETSYMFDNGKSGEAEYLDGLLQQFTEFMRENNYKTDEPYSLWMEMPGINMFAESISELYTNFKLFVEGYKALYKQEG